MLTFFIHIIGYMLIWAAVHIGRKKDSEIKVFSWNFLVQVLLIAVGVSIATSTYG